MTKEDLKSCHIKWHEDITEDVFNKIGEKLEEIGFREYHNRYNWKSFEDPSRIVINHNDDNDFWVYKSKIPTVNYKKEIQVSDILGEDWNKKVKKWSVGSYVVFLRDYGGHPKGTIDVIVKDKGRYVKCSLPYDGECDNPCNLIKDKEASWFATKEEAEAFAKTIREPEEEVIMLKPNNWYKHTSNDALGYYISDTERYGFNYEGLWSTTMYMNGNSTKWELADEDYVKERLLKYAKENYPEGTKYEGHVDGNFTVAGDIYFISNNIFCRKANVCIYYGNEGTWAKIISKPEKTTKTLPERNNKLKPNTYYEIYGDCEAIIKTPDALKYENDREHRRVKCNYIWIEGVEINHKPNGSICYYSTNQSRLYKKISKDSDKAKWLDYCKDNRVISFTEFMDLINNSNFKVGDWVYAEKQSVSDYRLDENIPIFQIKEVFKTNHSTWLRPELDESTGILVSKCRKATPEEIASVQPKYTELKANTGKFKVGDKVRVTRKAESKEGGWDDGWVDEMNSFIGKEVTIDLTSSNSYHMKEGYYYPEFVLELVTEETEKNDLFEENQEEICEHCKHTYYDGYVNTGPHNLCEGSRCEEASESWLEEQEDSTEQDTWMVEATEDNVSTIKAWHNNMHVDYNVGSFYGLKDGRKDQWSDECRHKFKTLITTEEFYKKIGPTTTEQDRPYKDLNCYIKINSEEEYNLLRKHFEDNGENFYKKSKYDQCYPYLYYNHRDEEWILSSSTKGLSERKLAEFIDPALTGLTGQSNTSGVAYKVGCYVELLTDLCGFKKGDIAIIRKDRSGILEVFVPNRTSTSAMTPNVGYATNNTTPSTEEAYNFQLHNHYQSKDARVFDNVWLSKHCVPKPIEQTILPLKAEKKVVLKRVPYRKF